MAPKPLIPPQLTHRPFTLDEARTLGLSKGHLRGATWRRIGRATYVWKELRSDPMLQLEAASRRLPSGYAFSGLTAAWLHGIDVAPCDPIEVTVPVNQGISSRAGISLRRSAISAGDIVRVRGVTATSLARTLADLSSRLSLTEAVVVTDAALHSRRIRLEQLRDWAESNSPRPGIRSLRRVIGLAEPGAESPMESRLRMLLVLAGLPRPELQVLIRDADGRPIGRPDLYYRAQRLGIEYDGAVHRTTLAEDNRRQNLLLSAGVRVLRFTAADVLHNPEAVVNQVRAMLGIVPPAGKRAHQKRPSAPSAGKGRYRA